MPSKAAPRRSRRRSHVDEKFAPTRRSTAGPGKRSRKTGSTSRPPAAKPKLLAGGNPQIAKGDGDAPVQAYIAAMPGWKRDLGRRLDALVARNVPHVRKAVRWNSPFYGVEGQGWFLTFHCFARYVKVAFFRGRSLRPVPPGASRHDDVRYLDVHEDDALDVRLLAHWIRQASKLPGWSPEGPATVGERRSGPRKATSPSTRIDARIEELGDWKGRTLARIRALVHEADPDAVEQWKWRGVPVWSHDGPICTGETYKDVVKLTFFRGASLEDPAGLFNASLEGKARRAIDLHEGDDVDAEAFRALVRAAVEANRS